MAFTVWNVGPDVAAGWESKTVSIDLDPNCAASTSVMGALNAAIALWNGVPTSDLVLSVGNTQHALSGSITTYTNGPAVYTGNPLVYCDTNFVSDNSLTLTNGYSGIPGSDMQPTLACDPGSHYCKITGSIVLLNFDASDGTNIDALAAIQPNLPSIILAHELGHALGLGHSADTKALMYFDASSKKQLRLAQDDVNGLSYLYPRSELGGDKVFGCGTIEAVNGSRPGGPGTGAATELALLLLSCFAAVSAFKRPARA
jgi:hypothetical protein